MTTVTNAERVTVLSQVIAIRTGVKTDIDQALTKNYHMLKRQELLRGQVRTYKPNDDDDFVYPSETQNVQIRAEEVLRNVTKDLARLFDVTACMDWTNQSARADVVLLAGDEPFVLLQAVPVSYLMFLEKQLVNVETVVRNLPVLDATEVWEFDSATDTFKSAPVGTIKTKKIRRSHVLAPATDRHPAQVESFTEDEPIGVWTTVKYSGAIPAQRLNKMLARVKALAEAVKFARESANMVEVADPKPGRRILDYVFNVED